MARHLYKQLLIPVLLFGAFYIAGTIGRLCEEYHHSITMSCLIFLIIFGAIMSFCFKIYHSFSH